MAEGTAKGRPRNALDMIIAAVAESERLRRGHLTMNAISRGFEIVESDAGLRSRGSARSGRDEGGNRVRGCDFLLS